jgi:dihydrofolate reductase
VRELVYYVATSLDGFIAGPGGETDAFPVEGDHMAVLSTRFADAVPTHVASALGIEPDGAVFDTVLMGWATYSVAADVGIASPYAHLRQFVFSRSPRPEADGVTITAEDPAAVARRLKAERADAAVWLCGGGSLAAALVDEIDRLVLKVNPVVLGTGIPLFGSAAFDPRGFALEASTRFESGVLLNEYRRVRA